jgi:inhibitor of cysteine peptidase
LKKSFLALMVIAVIVPLLVAASGCSSKPGANLEVSSDEFAQTLNIVRTIEIKTGSKLTLLLASNQTTGFQWTQQAQIADASVLEQTSHRYIKPTTTLAGAGGQEEWTFNVVKSGQTTISMNYSRPWAGGEQNINTFQLTVNVINVP